ncbi:hypothetical protein Acsp05_56670 [Actinokineospora sp. NBRC 105648]|nr:hypothetical protein Acsp05_56670 [Actinokineospora sp. NBRC 105648]
MTAPGTVLVTGATSGIGLAAAGQLAAAGWTVLVHGRTPERAALACAQLAGNDLAGNESTGNGPAGNGPAGELVPVHADLSALAEVRRLADSIGTTVALVNNAGVFTPSAIAEQRRVSADGHELTWAVNYLAPFALTTALAGRLGAVVNVTSGMHVRAEPHWADPDLVEGWDRVRAYGQSKLALTAFSAELGARWPAVPVTAVNPGYVDTPLVRAAFGGPAGDVSVGAAHVVAPLLGGSPVGGYVELGVRAVPHPLVEDSEGRARLWALTERLLAARPV